MRIKAIHFVLALNPRLLIVYLCAPLWQVVEVLRGTAEVLHSVRVIAIRPIMFLVQNGAEGRLVAIKQKLVEGQVPLKLVEILLETLLSHNLFKEGAALCLEGQRVVPLQFFVQGRDLLV